jgi:hypothetical protein
MPAQCQPDSSDMTDEEWRILPPCRCRKSQAAGPASIRGVRLSTPCYRHILCSRIHTPQSDSMLLTAGRAALATQNHKETTI